jgi:hypothetical protein
MEKSNSHPIDRQNPLKQNTIIVLLNETGLLSTLKIDHISDFLTVILSDCLPLNLAHSSWRRKMIRPHLVV